MYPSMQWVRGVHIPGCNRQWVSAWGVFTWGFLPTGGMFSHRDVHPRDQRQTPPRPKVDTPKTKGRYPPYHRQIPSHCDQRHAPPDQGHTLPRPVADTPLPRTRSRYPPPQDKRQTPHSPSIGPLRWVAGILLECIFVKYAIYGKILPLFYYLDLRFVQIFAEKSMKMKAIGWLLVTN